MFTSNDILLGVKFYCSLGVVIFFIDIINYMIFYSW